METKESVTDVFAAVSAEDASFNGLLKPAGRASSRASSLRHSQRGGSREPSARPGSRGINKTPNAGLMAPFKEAVEEEEEEEEEATAASFKEQEALMLA